MTRIHQQHRIIYAQFDGPLYFRLQLYTAYLLSRRLGASHWYTVQIKNSDCSFPGEQEGKVVKCI